MLNRREFHPPALAVTRRVTNVEIRRCWYAAARLAPPSGRALAEIRSWRRRPSNSTSHPPNADFVPAYVSRARRTRGIAVGSAARSASSVAQGYRPLDTGAFPMSSERTASACLGCPSRARGELSEHEAKGARAYACFVWPTGWTLARTDPTRRCFSGAGAEPTRSTEQKGWTKLAGEIASCAYYLCLASTTQQYPHGDESRTRDGAAAIGPVGSNPAVRIRPRAPGRGKRHGSRWDYRLQ